MAAATMMVAMQWLGRMGHSYSGKAGKNGFR
jgi:hypothetical protein